jgi:tetratricopeptide (TPR) repeat protein
MSEHRTVLYGTALVVAGALTWAGFIREVHPGTGVLFSTCKHELALARTLPLTVDGRPNENRRRMLDDVDRKLELLEQILREDPEDNLLPGGDFQDILASVYDFRAYGRYLARDREKALEFYGKILKMEKVESERRSRVYRTMARIYLEMGRSETTLVTLDRLEKELPGLTGTPLAKTAMLRARGLKRQGAPVGEVVSSLERATAAAGGDTGILVQAAEMFDQCGLREQACVAYERAAVNQPRSLFPLARLKFRAGDVDGATRALVKLAQVEPDYLRARLPEEKGMQGLARDPRLKRILDQ